MIKIAVVDDVNQVCDSVEKNLNCFAKKQGRKISIDVYSAGKNFIKALEVGEKCDLIFMDIDLEEQSGIEIVKHLCEKLQDECVQIVFISAKTEYAMELFEMDKKISSVSIMDIENRMLSLDDEAIEEMSV